MNIAFCSSWDIAEDGIADYSKHLVGCLKKCNAKVEVLKLGYYIADKKFYDALARRANTFDLCHVQFNYVYFNGELPYINRFLYFIKQIRVPVVMTVHELNLRLTYAEFGFKNIYTKFIYNHTLPFWNAWSCMYHKAMFCSVRKIIVHTEAQAHTVERLLGNSSRLALIPHGIPEISEDAMGFSSQAAKRALGLEGKIVLSIFGFIKRQKGYEVALEMLTRLPENIMLLIAGGIMQENARDKEYYVRLSAKITSLHLRDRVKIIGYIPEDKIPLFMAATDICLAPFLQSQKIGSGSLSLCIGYRKPIIASDISMITELHERVPFLETFAHSNTEDLLHKVRKVLHTSGYMDTLVRLTNEYRQKYSFSKIAEMLLDLYEEVA